MSYAQGRVEQVGETFAREGGGEGTRQVLQVAVAAGTATASVGERGEVDGWEREEGG